MQRGDLKRFEARGDHPALGTTATSGLVDEADALTEAQEFARSGFVNIVIVDHETGREARFDPGQPRLSKD